MTAYYLDEGVFELPSGLTYVDRSVHLIEVPGALGVELGLVIERRPIPEGESLLDVVGAQREDQARKLRGYTELGVGERVVDGLPALETRSRWRHARGPIYHVQVHVQIAGVCLTLTASTLHERAAVCDAWMSALLSTMRFRPR